MRTTLAQFGLGCCLLLLSACQALWGAEPATEKAPSATPPALPWQKLLRPDSLIGWNYGPSTKGWSIAEGVLTGTADAKPLLSGYSVGDFEFYFASESSNGAQAELMLTPIAGGEPLLLELLPECLVLRSGGSLQLHTAGGGKVLEKELPASARYALGLAVKGGEVKITTLNLREPTGDSLFNGADLTGWHTPGKLDAWHAEDGKIVKRGGGGNYLRSDKQYGNFTLSLDYKMSKGNNSGIGIRTSPSGWPSSDGMELQLLDRPGTDFGSNMSIYRNVPPLATAHKSEEWNHCVIKADGYIISAWINGELVQHFNTFRHPELKFRQLQGWIGFQDHGGIAEFKNIRLLSAPEGTGLKAWTAPIQPDPAEQILDRLMNPSVLARQDGIKTSVIEASVFSQEEKTLVDIQGPGALVGANVMEGGGTLAFYFDHESKPRFAGQLKSLRAKLPILSDQAIPLVTYVPFAERLRIVQLPSVGGRYLFEFVSFPSDMPIETMGDPVESVPRAWLATIDYRHNHYKYGQHRENDPQPRAGEKNKTIEPGSAVPLLSLSDSGIVQWWKLQADPKLLESDDLWLEITVDGESKPALSAPARYLFAPIADGHKHNNFLFTQAGGAFTRLAMPYKTGITILARNKGDQPLKGVGLTASYLPFDALEATDAEAFPLRLRGVYLPAESAEFKLETSGKLLGVVYDNATVRGEQSHGRILIDGEPLAGWKDGNNRLVMGETGSSDPESRQVLSGRTPQLAWRYFLLAPPDFSMLTLPPDKPPLAKLVLYYGKQP